MKNKEVYYTIYQTTNNINGKIYIGNHITQNINDYYLGSGIAINRAIKKYGKENFTKEVLYLAENEDELVEIEAVLVDLDFVERTDTYNIMTGGFGGSKHSSETKQKISKALTGKNPSNEARSNMSAAQKRRKRKKGKRYSPKSIDYSFLEKNPDFKQIKDYPKYAISINGKVYNMATNKFVSNNNNTVSLYNDNGRRKFQINKMLRLEYEK